MGRVSSREWSYVYVRARASGFLVWVEDADENVMNCDCVTRDWRHHAMGRSCGDDLPQPRIQFRSTTVVSQEQSNVTKSLDATAVNRVLLQCDAPTTLIQDASRAPGSDVAALWRKGISEGLSLLT